MRSALDDVAHDLRAPLTRIRSSAEIGLCEQSEVEARTALADVVEETDAILAMLRALMDVSEAEAGAMRLDREPLQLDALIEDARDLYEHVAEENGRDARGRSGHRARGLR